MHDIIVTIVDFIKGAKKYVIESTNAYSVNIPIGKRFIFEEICNLNQIIIKKTIYNNSSIYYEIYTNLSNIYDLFNKISLETQFLETIETKVEV